MVQGQVPVIYKEFQKISRMIYVLINTTQTRRLQILRFLSLMKATTEQNL